MHDRGFTTVELLLALLLATMLLGFGVPAFIDLIHSNRLTAQANALVGSLHLARSSAVHQGVAVQVRARDGVWDHGWDVVDGAGTVLRRFPPAAGVQVSSAGAETAFRYDVRGFLTSNADVLHMCRERGRPGQQVVIGAQGHAAVQAYTGC